MYKIQVLSKRELKGEKEHFPLDVMVLPFNAAIKIT